MAAVIGVDLGPAAIGNRLAQFPGDNCGRVVGEVQVKAVSGRVDHSYVRHVTRRLHGGQCRRNILAKIIEIRAHGDPSVLRVVNTPIEAPGTAEVRLVQDAVGVNYVDTMIRKGLYAMRLPGIPGFEAAGTVAEIGAGVGDFAVGDRVAYFFTEGAYATERVISTTPLIRLPDDVSNETAATFLAKGLTAWMALYSMHELKAGETALVLGASGSVGSMLSRWARSLGATVVGVAGSPDKLGKMAAGVTHAFHAQDAELHANIHEVAPDGVDVVYDFVGQATFALAAASVRDGGAIAAIGAASGQPSPAAFDLAKRGVQVRSGGTPQYVRGRSLDIATSELWGTLRAGVFGDLETVRYRFDDIARVHDDMDRRRLDGLPVLIT
jgi:NADPH:quinone reductase